MPIDTSAPTTVFGQEAFHAVDREVTGCAFDIHNQFGRYLDERLYQEELAARLERRNRNVQREMCMRLNPALYRDAITHFLGGESNVVRNIEIHSAGRRLGHQRVHLVAPGMAFSVTTAIHRPDIVCEHLHRFLRHTDLQAMQWINLNAQTVTLHTITR